MILVPICMGTAVYSKAELRYKFFFYLLLFGFLVDGSNALAYFYSAQYSFVKPVAKFLYVVYKPIEAIGLMWFIRFFLISISQQKRIVYLAISMVPAWIFFSYLFPALVQVTDFRFFDALYRIIVAYLAYLALLQLTKKPEPLIQQPAFWFLGGVFYYCFSTFFIMVLQKTQLKEFFWWVHNAVNISAYIIYTVGFLKIRTTAKTQSSLE